VAQKPSSSSWFDRIGPRLTLWAAVIAVVAALAAFGR
jgi:hypothetical protein